ncbi:MAG: hypothetical protein VX730_01855 [Pseudomonadota bacterium]|nr:hypothetical protein [Pseudomonadota bacterium]
MPDFKKFLKDLGIGDKQTFKSSNTTKRFDKAGNLVEGKAKPVKPQVQDTVSHTAEAPSLDDLKNSAVHSLQSRQSQPSFLTRFSDMSAKAKELGSKAVASTQSVFKSGVERIQSAAPILSRQASQESVQPEFKTSRTVSPENAEPADLSEVPRNINLTAEPEVEFSTTRTVSPKQAGNVSLADVPSRLHLQEPGEQTQDFDLAEKDSQPEAKPETEQPKRKGFLGRMFQSYVDGQMRRAHIMVDLAGNKAQLAELRAQKEAAKEVTEPELEAEETLEQAPLDPAKQEELDEKVAKIKDAVEKHERQQPAGQILSSSEGAMMNEAWEDYTQEEAAPETQPEQPKRPKGKGTKYMGGAHVETVPGHTADNPDKSLNDAWSAYARDEMKKDALRESEQARKEGAYLDEVEAEQIEQDAPER